ncbi:MAG: flavin monoamine oxidase family protein [Anaerolineae bacterium]
MTPPSMPRTITDYMALAQRGLAPHATKAARVLVLGAGMAGLVAAYELARAGHDPLLIEARERVGGRIETIRAPFSPGLDAEAGPMRIPRAHEVTLHYARAFGLPLTVFYHASVEPFYRVNGTGAAAAVVDDRAGAAAVIAKWEATVAPLLAKLRSEGEAAWPALIAEYDHHSLRGFLVASGWDEGDIALYAAVINQGRLLQKGFIEALREEADHSYVDALRIVGGMDLLPAAFVPVLRSRLRLATRVVAIRQEQHSVTVRCEGPDGGYEEVGDYAVVTLPLPVLRRLDTHGALSAAKEQAIREAGYVTATKVFLQCRSRFWQEDGVSGGGASTELPLRRLYYPDWGATDGRGVLVASYTWGGDAEAWAALPDGERTARAASQVLLVHPRARGQIEQGVTKIWHADPYARAAVALFDPGQSSGLQATIDRPEGRLHFAGEHASPIHGWIEGAVLSGLRAAAEVHERARQS